MLAWDTNVYFVWLIVGSPPRPYDLLWPVGRRREISRTGGRGSQAQIVEIKKSPNDSPIPVNGTVKSPVGSYYLSVCFFDAHVLTQILSNSTLPPNPPLPRLQQHNHNRNPKRPPLRPLPRPNSPPTLRAKPPPSSTRARFTSFSRVVCAAEVTTGNGPRVRSSRLKNRRGRR